MEFSVGDSVEAVDQLGIWTKAKVVSKSDNAIVVNFPPWRAEWDREIIAPSEIRKVTPEETLIPRRFANNKVRSCKDYFFTSVHMARFSSLVCFSFIVREIILIVYLLAFSFQT